MWSSFENSEACQKRSPPYQQYPLSHLLTYTKTRSLTKKDIICQSEVPAINTNYLLGKNFKGGKTPFLNEVKFPTHGILAEGWNEVLRDSAMLCGDR